MNVFAKFDEIPSMILQDIKEIKRYGHKSVSDTQSFGQRENSIPSQNSLGGGGGGGGGGGYKDVPDGRIDCGASDSHAISLPTEL